MLKQELKFILKKNKRSGANSLYLRSLLKEYLQVLVLSFLYNDRQYQDKLIFTGGTCLRHLFDLPRLSEDLDFDCVSELETGAIADDIQTYFTNSYGYRELKISIKQKGKQILLKFPLLRELELADSGESNWLYIKLDLSLVAEGSFETHKTARSIFGYNFVALHYDLPSLFAGKVNAILTRELKVGRENKETIKGRDFFDLLWYLKKGVKPNLQFLEKKLSWPELSIEDLGKKIDKKVELACSKYKQDFRNDLLPFIEAEMFVNNYVDNYFDEYQRLKQW